MRSAGGGQKVKTTYLINLTTNSVFFRMHTDKICSRMPARSFNTKWLGDQGSIYSPDFVLFMAYFVGQFVF